MFYVFLVKVVDDTEDYTQNMVQDSELGAGK